MNKIDNDLNVYHSLAFNYGETMEKYNKLTI